MKEKWEDIFKESLEDYSSSLPEGSLESFQRRLQSQSAGTSSARLKSAWWISVPAAACLALALVLNHGHSSDSGRTRGFDNVVAEAVPVVTNSTAAEPVLMESFPSAAEAVPGFTAESFFRDASALESPAANTVTLSSSDAVSSDAVSLETVSSETVSSDAASSGAVSSETVSSVESSGTVLSMSEEVASESSEMGGNGADVEDVSAFGRDIHTAALAHKRKSLTGGVGNVISASAGILGGALGGILLPSLSPAMKMDMAAAPDYMLADVLRNGDFMTMGNPYVSELEHSMPFIIGLSARFALSERFYLTTGLEYSLYRTVGDRYLSGSEIQKAHYLGIPLRLDYTALKTNRLDLYLGAGLLADSSLAATVNGSAVAKDNVVGSLMAAGGATLKLNDCVGLYVEPRLYFNPQGGDAHLETYRTAHPLMFSVSTGLRFTLFDYY